MSRLPPAMVRAIDRRTASSPSVGVAPEDRLPDIHRETGRVAPMVGINLADLRMQLGRQIGEMLFLTGMSSNAWIEEHRSVDPLNSPTSALSTRWMSEFAELVPTLDTPSPEEFYHILGLMQALDLRVTLREMSLALGRDEAAGSRWLTQGAVPPAAVLRLMYYVALMIEEQLNRPWRDLLRYHIGQAAIPKEVAEAVANVWGEWLLMVDAEARARGVEDLWVAGSWTAPGQVAKDPDAVDEEPEEGKSRRKKQAAPAAAARPASEGKKSRARRTRA